MAITLDNATWNPSSASFSHTVGTGSNTLLIVGVKSVGSGVSCTYNSVSMTQINQIQVGATGEYVTLFYLVSPTTGSNTVAFSGASAYTAVASSYFGAKLTGIPDAQNSTNSSSAATISTSVTTTANNCWLVSFMRNDADFSDANGGNATTRRGGTESSIAYFDSNGDLTPAGSFSGSYKTRGGGTANWGLVIASIAPAVTTTSSRSSLILAI